MVKVLLIAEKLEHYRVDLFNYLCSSIDLTLAHPDDFHAGCDFNQVKLTIKRYGPFLSFYGLDYNQFDVVVFPHNIRILSLFHELLKKRKYKLGLFGIGVSASYRRFYDEKSLLNILRFFCVKEADFSIFYEQYPYIKYKAKGVNPNKMSIAYNTVKANSSFSMERKVSKSFLFLGTLYKQKHVDFLIKSYYDLYLLNPGLLDLEIVGAGTELDNLIALVKNLGLSDKVIFHGQINDDEMLLPIMERSVVCISPGQAGLSVQKCFSYGVGFITTRNAITGGEIFSIIDDVTGNYFDGTKEGLKKQMIKYLDVDFAMKISENSHLFFNKFRNLDIWKEGFIRNIL